MWAWPGIPELAQGCRVWAVCAKMGVMRNHVCLLAALLVASCAHRSAQRPGPEATETASAAGPDAPTVVGIAGREFSLPRELPIPEDLKPQVQRASQIGRELYLQDRAASIGVGSLEDFLGKLDEKTLRGYVAQRDVDTSGRPMESWTVSFFSPGAEPKIPHRIRVYPETGRRLEVQSLEPPDSVNPRLLPLIRARQAALAAQPTRGKPVIPVVVPPSVSGEEGIVVYLLAFSQRRDVVVLGPHHRVVLGADGQQVQGITTLGGAAEEMPLVPSDLPPSVGGDPWPMGISHSGPCPLETHVYASMLHRLQLFVSTPRGRWHIDGDRIRYDSSDTSSVAR